MSFLKLHQAENDLPIDQFFHDPASSSSNSFLTSLHNSEQRVFSCSYCRRKFFSPQAFGGHQNAHKLERTLAKKSRELSSAGRHEAQWNHGSSMSESTGSTYVGRLQQPVAVRVHDQGQFCYSEMGINMDYGDKGESVKDDYNNLDLSLKL